MKTETLLLNDIEVPGYERVIEIIDPSSDLHGFIAIHSTRLGPALGGIRIWPYELPDHALRDVLRLAKGMTYKAALSQTETGGGKGVIISKRGLPLTKEQLMSFAEAVNSLEGLYIGAEDVGMTPDCLAWMRPITGYLVGLSHPKSSGDPSHYTSFGALRGIQAVASKLWGNSSLKGKSIAIQGLGAVGMKLANFLFWEGAQLIVSDIHVEKLEIAARTFGAKVVSTNEIHKVSCDIFSPCALGGILNEKTIPELKCKAVAGLANNQLLQDEDGERLHQRKILYAPDYLINAGGLLNVSVEIDERGYDASIARSKVDRLYDQLLLIFNLSEKEGISTSRAADRLAEHNLKHQIGKRERPIIFHH